MFANSTAILCDGCGLPASPEHIAARTERLELGTRFRPIHIHVLFVALAPMPRPEDDFYGPPQSRDFFDSLLSELDISPSAEKTHAESNGVEAAPAKLLEFQRRGYYLTYLSECPMPPQYPASPGQVRALPSDGSTQSPQELGADPEDESVARECISRLAPTLIKRIRFNYKPKHVALLGTNLSPLIEVFEQAGIGSLLLLNQGGPLTILGCGLHLEPAIRSAGSTWSLP